MCALVYILHSAATNAHLFLRTHTRTHTVIVLPLFLFSSCLQRWEIPQQRLGRRQHREAGLSRARPLWYPESRCKSEKLGRLQALWQVRCGWSRTSLLLWQGRCFGRRWTHSTFWDLCQSQHRESGLECNNFPWCWSCSPCNHYSISILYGIGTLCACCCTHLQAILSERCSPVTSTKGRNSVVSSARYSVVSSAKFCSFQRALHEE
jgi:hypothetical protein